MASSEGHDDQGGSLVPLDRADNGMRLPRMHSEAVRAEALRLLAGGMTPGEVCKVLEVPRGTLAWWKRCLPGFSEAYAHAIRSGADHLAAETVEIADDCPADKEEVNRARLRVHARQWLAGRYDPQTYGDRVQHDHSGEVTVRRTRFRSLLGERRVVDASFDASDATSPADGTGPGAQREGEGDAGGA